MYVADFQNATQDVLLYVTHVEIIQHFTLLENIWKGGHILAKMSTHKHC